MNRNHSSTKAQVTKHLTLEQKIRHLVRNYRARQRRAGEKADGHSRCEPPRKLVAFALVLLSLISLPARAESPSAFEQANQDYAAGRFMEAARGFERVIEQRGYSGPVLFNLGNAWLQAGQPGRAILSYERALWLSPGNEAVEANLHAARQEAGLVVEQQNNLEKAARVLSLDAWAWLGAGTLVLVCALVIACRLLPSFSRTGLRMLICAAAAALVVETVCVVVCWPDVNRAVVQVSATPVRIAPATAAGVSFSLPAGEVVSIGQTHGRFTFVTTRDGRSGWISHEEMARVI